MWLIYTFFAFGESEEWNTFLFEGSTLEDPAEGYGAIDIVGAMEWKSDESDFYVRFPVENATRNGSERWQIFLRSLVDQEICAFVIEEDSLYVGYYQSHLTPPLSTAYPIPIEEFSSRVTFPSEANPTFQIRVPLWSIPANHLPGFETSAMNWDDDNRDLFGVEAQVNPIYWLDPIYLVADDPDGDGLDSATEVLFLSDPNDADSDDDGLTDGMEWYYGGNPLVCDTDGDGLFDGLEAGVIAASTDTDLEAGCFIADPEPTTRTAIDVADTDGGGFSDSQEDINQNGIVESWETDPRNPEDDLDSDGDNIPDALEEQCPEGLSEDADGDGALDVQEGYLDTDEDNILNFCDPDDDNDGISSVEEGFEDIDGDGIPNAYDTDSDGDEILDENELSWDFDCDGIAEYLDNNPDDGPCSDSDGDGVLNDTEEECGTDPFNPDSDGDGLLDVDEECGANTDAETTDYPTPKDYTQPDAPKGCSHNPFLPHFSLFILGLLLRRK